MVSLKLAEYLPILLNFYVGCGLALFLFLLSYLGVQRSSDVEKVSAYECGFEPFGDARLRFDIRFYLVALLFIVFDLEVTFLFPWATSLSTIGFFGFLTMIFFLAILTIGFVYEWVRGALDWE